MNNTPLLQYKNIVAHYGAITALNDVSLEIYENEIVTLIGANGAGKTTLLMSLFKEPPITAGSILFEGTAIHHLSPHEIIKLGISVSPEGRRIFPKLTVEENLQLGAFSIKNKTQNQMQQKYIYSLFPILYDRRAQRAGTLSGGEQQMLAIGRGLMPKPRVFFLDEPSLGLAPLLVTQIFKILSEIAKAGTTLFLVEQNANHALKLAHRGYVLVNGKIELTGTGQSLLNNTNIQSAYLGKHRVSA